MVELTLSSKPTCRTQYLKHLRAEASARRIVPFLQEKRKKETRYCEISVLAVHKRAKRVKF